MIPFLYSETATNKYVGCIGKLTGAKNCFVTETLDGEYELIMNYNSKGNLFDEIDYNKMILAKPNASDDPQLFRIYRINKQARGGAVIYARHISYDMEGAPVNPFSFSGIEDFFEKLFLFNVSSNSFVFDVKNPISFPYGDAEGEIKTPENMRKLVYETAKNIFDCEIKWNNTNADVVSARATEGFNEGYHYVRYGKNLVDLVADGVVTDLYTGVFPYYIENDTVYTLPEEIVRVDGYFGFERILTIDLTNAINESGGKLNEVNLRGAAEQYIEENQIGKPKVSIDLQIVNQYDFGEIPYNEIISLGDFFEIDFPKLNISTTARCVSLTWDVLRDRCLNYVIES